MVKRAEVRRGEIWWVDLGDNLGSEPSFIRPALVIQANAINRSTFKTIVTVGITSNTDYADIPGNVLVEKSDGILPKDSVICVAHLAAVDRSRFTKKIADLPALHLDQVEYGIALVLDLT